MENYNLSEKEILKKFNTTPLGLSEKEAENRIKQYGENIIQSKKTTPLWSIFIRQFNSPVVYILIAALIISSILKEVVDSIVIGAILVLNGFFGFIQEFRAEKAIEALKKLESLKAKVLRDGKVKEIDSSLLVPGDIILLEVGDKVPADARLILDQEIKTQEAILTGESSPIIKTQEAITKEKISLGDQKNMLFSGTTIVNGKGKAVIVSTAMKTEIGKIANLINKIEIKETPLQNKVKQFGKTITIAVIAIAIIVFLGGFLKGGEIIEMLLVGVSLAVAAIPEGLVVVMTIALALGTQRMIKRNALMRKLAAVETLGSTTVICSDKTGTITKNEMTVRKIFANNQIIEVTGSGYDLEGSFTTNHEEIDKRDIFKLLEIGCLNNNSEIQELIGDPTELALIVSAEKSGLKRDVLENKNPRIKEIMFTSERKMMTTVHQSKEGKKEAFIKGAPERVLKLCTKIYDKGRIRKIMPHERKMILKVNEEFAKDALRVLGFAFKPLKKSEEVFEKDLVFVGLQGMIDPPRIEVKEAIKKCNEAGISVKIITGDQALTANSIAEEVGIEGKVMTGEELRKMDQSELSQKVNSISVFARVNPEDKLRIVEILKKRGEVVAMTGDGINDAPALKKADIGIAMGIKGTDVSKESSDMILIDDDFTSIVSAVEEGRGIYDNIKKFTNYLLSSNLGEVLIIFMAILLGFSVDGKIALPLIAIQILWINLVTDGLPALALGIDPISKNIMKRKPRKKTDQIIDKNMGANILLIGVILTIISLLLFNKFLPDLAKAQTVVFTSLVIFEMIRGYMIKAQYGEIFNNHLLLVSILVAIALQVTIIYTPLNNFFKIIPLGTIEWMYIMGATIVFAILGFSGQAILKKIMK